MAPRSAPDVLDYVAMRGDFETRSFEAGVVGWVLIGEEVGGGRGKERGELEGCGKGEEIGGCGGDVVVVEACEMVSDY